MFPKLIHLSSYRVRCFKAAIILAYSEGSFDLNPAEAPNILTKDLHYVPQPVNENVGTGP